MSIEGYNYATGEFVRVRVDANGRIETQDTGVHTNPEQWLQDYHWDCDQVAIIAVNAGGQQNLGAAVGAGLTRRIREITIRHSGTETTVVSILVGTDVRVSLSLTAGTTVVWSSDNGRSFEAAQQPIVQASNVTGGTVFISASGVEQ